MDERVHTFPTGNRLGVLESYTLMQHKNWLSELFFSYTHLLFLFSHCLCADKTTTLSFGTANASDHWERHDSTTLESNAPCEIQTIVSRLGR